jgi:hypothetical protein
MRPNRDFVKRLSGAWGLFSSGFIRSVFSNLEEPARGFTVDKTAPAKVVQGASFKIMPLSVASHKSPPAPARVTRLATAR